MVTLLVDKGMYCFIDKREQLKCFKRKRESECMCVYMYAFVCWQGVAISPHVIVHILLIVKQPLFFHERISLLLNPQLKLVI